VYATKVVLSRDWHSLLENRTAFLRALWKTHMVQHYPVKSEGVWGIEHPLWAPTNGSPPQRYVSPGALAACLPGTEFPTTETPPPVTSG
jgi:hypothetical protein